jgi:hypothetical protein
MIILSAYYNAMISKVLSFGITFFFFLVFSQYLFAQNWLSASQSENALEIRNTAYFKDARDSSLRLRFFFEIALDSAFKNYLSGWNNRAFSQDTSLIGTPGLFRLEQVYPGATYYIRGRYFVNSLPIFSQTTSVTISSSNIVTVLPLQILDSSTALLRWIPSRFSRNCQIFGRNLLPSLTSTCQEREGYDTSLVPTEYRRGKRVVALTSDTIRGLIPNVTYYFSVIADTAGLPRMSIPAFVFSSALGVVGFTSENRNRPFFGRRSLSVSHPILPTPQTISYYETPWFAGTTRFFTMIDSNGRSDGRNTGIRDFPIGDSLYNTTANMYKTMLTRLDSMRAIGIPLDTVFIAKEGNLGYTGATFEFFPPFPCYRTRITCVFTLRRPDARVARFARAGNEWRAFSWDTDYYRLLFPLTTSVQEEQTRSLSHIPTLDCSPNPASDEAILTFSLPFSAQTSIEVFSVFGQRMAAFPLERRLPGVHTLPLQTRSWASGTYLVRLRLYDTQGGSQTLTHKLSLLH